MTFAAMATSGQWEEATTEGFGEELSNSKPSVCHEEIYQGYKTLVKNVADSLQKEDVDSIKFIEDIPNGSNALDALSYLEKKGKFSCYNIEPLEGLLRDISRCDIITRCIEKYKQRYGSPTVHGKSPSALKFHRVSSAPPHLSPRLRSKRRSLQYGHVTATNTTTSHPVTEFHSLREEDEDHSTQGLLSLPAEFSGKSVVVVPGLKGWSHMFVPPTDSQGASQEAPDSETSFAQNEQQRSTMVGGGALYPRHSTPESSLPQLSQTHPPKEIPSHPHSAHPSGYVSADESYPCSFVDYTTGTSGHSSLHHTGTSSGHLQSQMDTTGLQLRGNRTSQIEPRELSNALQRRLSLQPHTHSSHPTLNEASSQPRSHTTTGSQPAVYQPYTPPQPLASKSVEKRVALDLAAASSDTHLSPSHISRAHNQHVPPVTATHSHSQSMAIPSASISSHSSQPGKQLQGISQRQQPKPGFNCVSQSWIVNRKDLCTNITNHNKGSYIRSKGRRMNRPGAWQQTQSTTRTETLSLR